MVANRGTIVLDIEHIHVICECLDVFPEDLPGLPPEHELKFKIELVPNTHHMSEASYKMAPVESIE